MPFDFPNSPTIGQIVTGSGSQQWQWDGVKWSALTGTYAGPPPGAIISATPPSYTAGSLWWDTNGAQLYVRYDDGNSVQWVPATNLMQLSDAATQADVARALGNVGRNLIHNPLMNIAQRGGGPFTTSGTYPADRWKLTFVLDTVSVGIAGYSDAQRTAIGDEAFLNFMQVNFTGNVGATAFTLVTQYIESVRRLANKTVTVSFIAHAGSALKLGVSIDQLFGNGGSPSAVVIGVGQAVTLTTTPTRYSLTFVVPSVLGKTLGTAGDDSTALEFWFSAGTTQATRAGNIGVQSGAIVISGVQLEIGNVATQLEKPDPRYDLSNCQRFYQAPAGAFLFGDNAGVGGGAFYHGWMFPVTMRATPTIVLSGISGANSSGTAVNSQSASMFAVQCVPTAANSSYTQFFMTASADL